ncbi:MAG: hypothetical protein V4642_16060 [Bacteroidota bacterium]
MKKFLHGSPYKKLWNSDYSIRKIREVILPEHCRDITLLLILFKASFKLFFLKTV